MTVRPTVLVIGGGILGAATAHALATGGAGRVVLLEAGQLASGASGRSGGMVRAFHSDPGLSDLARRSLPTWQDFGALVGGSCGFRRTGSAYIAPLARRESVAAEVTRLAAAGVRIELLSAVEARVRVPGCAFADDELVVFEPDAGWADVPAAVAAYAAAARAAGAEISEGCVVTGLTVRDGRVVGVSTPDGMFAADMVVLAAGLGALALIELPELYAKAIQVVRLGAEPAGDDGFAHPCYLSLATRSYARPTGPDTTWVGVASEAPLAGDAPVDADEAGVAIAHATARVPALATRTCTDGLRTGDLYTRGAIGTCGPAPGLPGLFLALGFGGTGFKVAPAVAADVAAYVLMHPSSPPSTGGDARRAGVGGAPGSVGIHPPHRCAEPRPSRAGQVNL